ncbi:sugar transferase [Fimbriiglobus ruber]|uniref:Sugar transferase n=1 Tax=Fimbriiglobus ruber TaxID=1908690 RepID=A0A225E252_9BACT|nr:sugar transferase [Fimbriiglobus ruber]OWK43569.1 sugar transferase [Fimbriiglobus ruber]
MNTAPMSKAPAPRTTGGNTGPVTTPRPALSRRHTAFQRPAPVPLPPSPPRVAERIKTALDYPLAAALLVAFAPVIALTMLAVRLTSRGPAVYSQARVGRGGRVFTIYKIRTMFHECESLTGPRWAIPGDPRVTPLGRVLRVLHLDELPQLWNVLRGDMAMIGPRPERPEICKQLRLTLPGYDFRHMVKPGITGFAQVHLPPDSNLQSVRNKVAYDRHYISRMGPGMDVYVYACTALKVLGLRRLYQRKPLKPADE